MAKKDGAPNQILVALACDGEVMGYYEKASDIPGELDMAEVGDIRVYEYKKSGKLSFIVN
jgi:hypothetical protein